ncbi:hypothetical protein ACFVMC_12340 [Nocardia sp. NPDC127579]|uniref:hypothetical protein n=1 Tax=Nocardia sp. NPDC127579 TaxID=3345402 RepID=UPI003640C5B3
MLLDQQDRTRWDTALIADSRALLDQAIVRARGQYVVQAAIAVLHTEPERRLLRGRIAELESG